MHGGFVPADVAGGSAIEVHHEEDGECDDDEQVGEVVAGGWKDRSEGRLKGDGVFDGTLQEKEEEPCGEEERIMMITFLIQMRFD